jgi:hypothetical protein
MAQPMSQPLLFEYFTLQDVLFVICITQVTLLDASKPVLISHSCQSGTKPVHV